MNPCLINTITFHGSYPPKLLGQKCNELRVIPIVYTGGKLIITIIHIYQHLLQPCRWPYWVWSQRKPHEGSGKPHWPRRKDPVCRNVSYRESSRGPNGTTLCFSPPNTPDGKKIELSWHLSSFHKNFPRQTYYPIKVKLSEETYLCNPLSTLLAKLIRVAKVLHQVGQQTQHIQRETFTERICSSLPLSINKNYRLWQLLSQHTSKTPKSDTAWILEAVVPTYRLWAVYNRYTGDGCELAEEL